MTEADWEATFWDLGGVILDTASVVEAHEQFVADLLAEHDVDASVEDAVETWQQAVGDHFRAREGTEFRAAREAYAVGVEAVVDDSLPTDAWRPRLDEHLTDVIRPVPGAVETLRRLDEPDVDLHVGLLSDVDTDEGLRFLDAFGVRDVFDSITTSEAVGRTKPDPAMFETAVENAGVDPRRSLMVGDRYEHDVVGASRAGLQAVAFGADDGPAVDYRVEKPGEVLEILGIEPPDCSVGADDADSA